MQSRGRKIVFRCLVLLCVLQAFWILINYRFSPELTRILERYPVGDKAMVYVIQSDAGGATVPFTYHYFVYQRIDDDNEALEALREDGHAFLVTRDHEAKTTVQGNRVEVSVRKKVLRFSSPAFFRIDGEYKSVDIWLDAQVDYDKRG